MQNVMFLVIISDLNIGTKFDASGIRRNQFIDNFNSVVLPVPLSPMIATCSPLLTSKEALEKSI